MSPGSRPDSLLTDLALARGPLHDDALRADPGWLGAVMAAGAVSVAVAGDAVPVAETDDGRGVALDWRPLDPKEAGTAILLDAGAEGAGADPQLPRVALLVDDQGDKRPEGFASLREIGGQLSGEDAGWATAAVALSQWHRRHRRCPQCGEPTLVSEAGWARTCPADGSQHFPRTDPAVIVLVRDPDDRALLGRRADWPDSWFSTLAGFVEAGESVEQAVRREVLEESGIQVDPDRLRYRGSQPWPFPNSLMLGFHAWSLSGAEPKPDGVEIAEARWFTRAEIADLGAGGLVRVPPRVSIARHLVEDWYGGPLSASWSRH